MGPRRVAPPRPWARPLTVPVPDGPRVDVREVGVRVGDDHLLHPVSLQVDAGRAVAVRGANGTGKTTLLRVLAGLARPTTGTALVGGSPPDDRDRRFRARLAALVGAPPLADNLTLLEHLCLVGASWGSSVADARTHGHHGLERLGIERLASRFPHELSSGQVQLFALALTLARPFDVLLLDEPEQRLDQDRLELVADALCEVVDAGAALVVASHSSVLVHRVADTTVVLGAEGAGG